ncbi:MAG: HlyD family efflux transporter periplasmic adaptor subunit [Phycisphaeraceae bacterium]|nr:HlyD family efflux transporter periplasmic adaptor subunit [Phycisphaeraceae bacterium]
MPGKRRTGRAITKIVIILAAVGGLGTGGVLLARSTAGGSGVTVREAELGTAERRTFQILASASGDLQARRQLEIKNPLETGTRIVEIIPEGTVVTEGQLLVELDADDISERLRQERLSVIAAQNDVDQAEGNYRIQVSENDSRKREAELKVELAQLALDRWREGEVAKRREELRIRAEKASDELVRLRDKLERTESLYARDFKSKDELDQDRIAAKEAAANDVIARLEVDIYENYQYPEEEKTKVADVEKAKADLAQVLEQNEINLKSRDAARQTAQQQLELRIEKRDELEADVSAARILAPRAGLVVYATSVEASRYGRGETLEVGTDVWPNMTLIVLPDTTEMVAVVRVHESLAGRVREKQQVTVKVEAVGRTFNGTVENIGVMAETGGWRDPNRREYSVRVILDANQPGTELLKPAMRCDAQIILDEAANVLSVPIAAVFSDGPVQYVNIPSGAKFVRKPVRLGKLSDMFAQIVAGLDGGERVLLRRPSVAEIDNAPWDPDALKAAGYTLNDKGEPVAPARPPMGGAPGQDQSQGQQRPQGERPSGERGERRNRD